MLESADRRFRSEQDKSNDIIMKTDMRAMTGERLQYYPDRQKLAKEDVKRELKRRKAKEEAPANAFVFFVTAALAAAVTPVTPIALVAPAEPVAPTALAKALAIVALGAEVGQLSEAH